MVLGTFVGGRYSSTWNSSDLGLTTEGYNINIVAHAQRINKTDAYGDSLIDYFYRGVDVTCTLDSAEYKAGSTGAAWPWGSLGAGGTVGRAAVASSIVQSLVLTAASGTPAASSPASLTGARSIIDPDFNIRLLFDSQLRTVPLQFVLLPSDSYVHFTTT